MNIFSILYVIGLVSGLEGLTMFLPCVVALIYGESEGICFLPVIAACLLIWLITRKLKPARIDMFAKESMISVTLSWIFMSILGALPFTLSGDIPNYLNALFETVSGFTTTGASILVDVEAMSRCMMFWRCFTHWIGGMGILVMMLAVIANAGVHSINLMKAESPGPSVGKFVPKLRATARLLYKIYFAITVAEMAALIICRMPVYDAVCISVASAGTGGFGVLADSCASYSAVQQIVIAVFVMLFGVNFSAYFFIITKKVRQALGIEEVRAYFAVIIAAVALIAVNTYKIYGAVGETLRHSFFQVVSIITTCGFATTDFNQWPMLSKAILLMLMFMGACAGSTGGGIKVSRIIVMIKSARNELRHTVQPKEIRQIYLNGKPVENDVMLGIYRYFMVYILVLVASFLLIAIENLDLTTTFSSVVATLNNIGPGLELAGPTENYVFFSPLSKIVLMADMLIGRLELMPVLIIAMPLAWKKSARKRSQKDTKCKDKIAKIEAK